MTAFSQNNSGLLVQWPDITTHFASHICADMTSHIEIFLRQAEGMTFLNKTGVARIILPLCALNWSVGSVARDCPPIDPKIDIGEVRAFWLEEINYSLYPEEFDKLAKRDACLLSDWVDLYSDGATRAKRKADARRAVKANRAAAKKRAADLERAASKRRAAWEAQEETIKADKRLAACDSFGFERATNAHAECAMKLYINEQNQNRDVTTVQNSGR